MAEPARRLATYEDLLAAPEHLIAEIIHGELITHPRPVQRHARAASRLGVILGASFEEGIGRPGWWYILDEPQIHFGPQGRWEITVPDLAGWRRERMPSPDETAYFTTVPDLICEFLSPSSRKDDRFRKPGLYASLECGTTGWAILRSARSKRLYWIAASCNGRTSSKTTNRLPPFPSPKRRSPLGAFGWSDQNRQRRRVR